MIIGVLGGLLGALFININFRVGKYRKRFFASKWKKVHEVTALVLMTATVIYFAPMLFHNSCLKEDELNNIEVRQIRYTCNKGEYNPLATFLFNPEGTVIKALLSKEA